MGNLVIKEVYESDTILKLIEKVNANFDQLILSSGGVAGPIGDTGAQGVAGPYGIRGSQWVADASGGTTINLPTDNVLRDNDFKINIDGGIDYYSDAQWLNTGITIIGATGPKGENGNGAISVLSGHSVTPDLTNTMWSPESLGGAIQLAPSTDSDDEAIGSDYINSGIDFISIGHGNNSLVLGRYANIFPTDVASTSSEYKPQGDNLVINNFPSEEENVSMLVIAQNDYKNPSIEPSVVTDFTNGISIGLNKSHDSAAYNTAYPFNSNRFDYEEFANISIYNRFFDFRIQGAKKVELSSLTGNSLELGTLAIEGTRNNISDFSTKLVSNVYTEFKLGDTILTEITNNTGIATAGVINRANFNYNESTILPSASNDLRSGISSNFFTSKDWSMGQANEIVLINKTNLVTNTSNDPSLKNKTELAYDTNTTNSDSQDNPFRLGQTVIGVPTNQDSTINLNINYQGQGYDQFLLSYSSVDTDTNTSINSINTTDGQLSNLLYDNEELLGYKSSDYIQENSKSLARMIVSPGFFRQEKNGDTFDLVNDPDSRNRMIKTFDDAHKTLPTGSIDVEGTIRLREIGRTDDGQKDGYVAVNKKNGIIGWEDPKEITGASTVHQQRGPGGATYLYQRTQNRPQNYQQIYNIPASTTSRNVLVTFECTISIKNDNIATEDYTGAGIRVKINNSTSNFWDPIIWNPVSRMDGQFSTNHVVSLPSNSNQIKVDIIAESVTRVTQITMKYPKMTVVVAKNN